MKKRYDIKICFNGLCESDRNKLKKDIAGASIQLSSIQGEGGIAQDILSFILEVSNSSDLPSIIKDGIIYDMIKELSRFTLEGVVMTLIVNGRRYVNQTIIDIKKIIGNILSKLVCHGDTLLGIVEKCIEKYNDEYHEKVALEKQSYLEEHFLHIDISNNIIHINQNIFVYLTFFYFGSPQLSHLYMLEKKLLSSGYNKEADIVFGMFSKELNDKQDRIQKFLTINPQWVTTQTLFAVMHELGHHYTNKHNDEDEIINVLIPSLIQAIDFGDNIIFHDEKGICLKKLIDDLCNEPHFLNELKADFFAIKHLAGSALHLGSDLELATILASIFGHSSYIEYTMKVNSMLVYPLDYSKEQRLLESIEGSLKSRIRLLVIAQLISKFLENISSNTEAMALYNNLISKPYYSHCNDFEEEFLIKIDYFHECLRNGFNKSNTQLPNFTVEQNLMDIESGILQLITQQLNNQFI